MTAGHRPRWVLPVAVWALCCAGLSVAFQNFAPPSGHLPVRGEVEGVHETENGKVVVSGWACQVGRGGIAVEVYVKEPDGREPLRLTRGISNLKGDDEIAERCQTGGDNRFVLEIPRGVVAGHEGSPIIVRQLGTGIELAAKEPLALPSSPNL